MAFFLSSPYGSKCESIHDPRAALMSPKTEAPWLPSYKLKETDFQETDVHVDWHFDAKRNVVNNKEIDSATLTCETLLSSIVTPGTTNKEDIVFKLTLLMMKKRSNKIFYKYDPKHTLGGKLCMVLSEAHFHMTGSDSFEEVKPFENPRNKYYFSVHEIAFGPYGSLDSELKPMYLLNLDPALLCEMPSEIAEKMAIDNNRTKKNERSRKVVKVKAQVAYGKVFQRPCSQATKEANMFIKNMVTKKQLLAYSHSVYFHDKEMNNLVLEILQRHTQNLPLPETELSALKMFLYDESSSVNAWPNTRGRGLAFVNSATRIHSVSGNVPYEPAVEGTRHAAIWSNFVEGEWRKGQSRFFPKLKDEKHAHDSESFDELHDTCNFLDYFFEHWGLVKENEKKKIQRKQNKNIGKWK